MPRSRTNETTIAPSGPSPLGSGLLERVAEIMHRAEKLRVAAADTRAAETVYLEGLAAELAGLLESPAASDMPLRSYVVYPDPRKGRIFDSRGPAVYVYTFRAPSDRKTRDDPSPAAAFAADSAGRLYVATEPTSGKAINEFGDYTRYRLAGSEIPEHIGYVYPNSGGSEYNAPDQYKSLGITRAGIAVAAFEAFVAECRGVHARAEEDISERRRRISARPAL